MIDDGRGEGQHLLPAENNVTPVGEDLLRNINRLPQQQGWRLLISEFGAGLAGNGDRLRAAVRRANPALKEFDGWIKTLADQDRLLGRLIDESDTVLAAWAERRKETAGFIDKAGATAAASAERGDDLERNWALFPGFLRELEPTMAQYTKFADQMTPALNSLDGGAPAINKMVANMGPFFSSTVPSLTSLGDFGDRARVLFPALRPLIGDLDNLGREFRPASKDLARLFGSFDDTGGIEELMKLIYFYTGTTNGVDAKGHYARGALRFVAPCLARGPLAGGCTGSLGNFGDPVKASATMASVPRTPEELKQAIAPETAIAGLDLESEDAKPLLDYFFGTSEGDR